MFQQSLVPVLDMMGKWGSDYYLHKDAVKIKGKPVKQ
jgi:hypothetical protein